MLEAIDAFEQPDGAKWKVFHITGGQLLLTSKGLELSRKRPEVWDYFREYRKRVVGSKALEGSLETREFFSSGANSSVYKMAPGLVVKEASHTGSALYAVQRMDRLCGVIEGSVPRWIDMPHHYGVLSARHLDRQYVLQQQVDSGVAVDWITHPEDLNDWQQEAVSREFGEVSQSEQETILGALDSARVLVSEALQRSGERPEDYLTDYHPGNVLIERLQTPVAGHNHKLWIIDQ